MAQVQKKTKAAPKPRQKKTNGYKFPEKLPVGEVLKDISKKEWSLGPSIGQGGFGEIYSAQELAVKGSKQYPYVIKIEPHENGPLFVEKHFYLKVAKADEVESWMKAEGLKTLGIPKFYGFGSHEFKNERYRFLVLERYGKDIWSIFLNNNKKFPAETVFKFAIQIIDILEYIHSKGYVHADIKGANLLLGLKKGTENQVYLVDFGLACKYSIKEFKMDPKRAHNGTIEYTSQDWHLGVPTRRGDMEILGFNLLHWIASSLPWEGDIKSPQKVQEKKIELMSSVKTYMKKHFPEVPNVIVQYLDYVSKLEPDDAPDYSSCRAMFKKGLASISSSINGELKFSSRQETPVKKSRGGATPRKKRQKVSEECLSDQELEEEVEEVASVRKTPTRACKAPTPKKMSWRDMPSVKASNIARPGEYTAQSVPKTRKRKDK